MKRQYCAAGLYSRGRCVERIMPNFAISPNFQAKLIMPDSVNSAQFAERSAILGVEL